MVVMNRTRYMASRRRRNGGAGHTGATGGKMVRVVRLTGARNMMVVMRVVVERLCVCGHRND